VLAQIVGDDRAVGKAEFGVEEPALWALPHLPSSCELQVLSQLVTTIGCLPREGCVDADALRHTRLLGLAVNLPRDLQSTSGRGAVCQRDDE